MDVVDQSVYLRAVGKTYVDQFTIYSEWTFLRLHPCRQNRVKMLQNFGDGDVDVCVNPANPEKKIRHLVDPHDLGALEAKAGHQTLLIEGEGVDAAVQRVGGEAAGHSFVHDDDARAGADLPAARVIYPVHCVLVHQEKSVT